MLQGRLLMNNKKSIEGLELTLWDTRSYQGQVTKFVLNDHLVSSTNKKLLNPLLVGSTDTVIIVKLMD